MKMTYFKMVFTYLLFITMTKVGHCNFFEHPSNLCGEYISKYNNKLTISLIDNTSNDHNFLFIITNQSEKNYVVTDQISIGENSQYNDSFCYYDDNQEEYHMHSLTTRPLLKDMINHQDNDTYIIIVYPGTKPFRIRKHQSREFNGISTLTTEDFYHVPHYDQQQTTLEPEITTPDSIHTPDIQLQYINLTTQQPEKKERVYWDTNMHSYFKKALKQLPQNQRTPQYILPKINKIVLDNDKHLFSGVTIMHVQNHLHNYRNKQKKK